MKKKRKAAKRAEMVFPNFESSSAKAVHGKIERTRREIRIERFILDQIDSYIKLHKEHEKDLRYIG